MGSLNPVFIAQVLVCAFFGVLFLQSGLDKVTDWKGNLEWLTGHFAKSPLAGMVPLLLAVVTVTELAAGLVSAVGVFFVLTTFRGETHSAVPMIGIGLSGLALLMLFAGQRIAKDYVGAHSLATYFGVMLLGLLVLAA